MYPDLLAVFIKRKFFLFLILPLGLLLAWLASLSLPKQYKVTNAVRIGRFMGVHIELPEFTKQRFKQIGFLADAFEADGFEPGIPRDAYARAVKVNIENDTNKVHNVDTLVFSTKAETAEKALHMNQALSDHLIEVHRHILAEARAIRQKEIDEWRATISETERSIAELEGALRKSPLAGPGNEAALILAGAKLQEQRETLFYMRQHLHRVILDIENPVNSYATEISSRARLPLKPVFPKLSLLAVGMTFLLALAWVVLCWLEYIWSLRQAAVVRPFIAKSQAS